MHGQNHIKYCRSLWLTAGTVGKVQKRRHVAKSCILIADRTQYSPCEEASTFSASQKNPPFYGTPKFITVFTPARHFSLSCATFNPIRPLQPHFLPSKQRPLRWPSTGRKRGKQSPYNRSLIKVCLYSFFALIAKWGGWSTPGSGRLIPGKQTRHPLYTRLGGLQGRSGLVRKLTPPPVFDPRTVQAVASRFAN